MNEGGAGGAGESYEGDASPFQRPARRPLLQRLVPVSEHVRSYRGGTLRRDLLAGATVAALAVPAALAYSEIAGLSPVIGLYSLLLPAVAYTLLGSSRQLIVGPDGAISALVGAAVIPLVADPEQRASLAALLALLVGGAFLGAWLARLGWIADYFSRPVLIGYLHGVAVVLIVGQLGKMLGLSINARDSTRPTHRSDPRDHRPQLVNSRSWVGIPGRIAVGPPALAEASRRTYRRHLGHRGIGCRRPSRQGSGRSRPYSLRPSQYRTA